MHVPRRLALAAVTAAATAGTLVSSAAATSPSAGGGGAKDPDWSKFTMTSSPVLIKPGDDVTKILAKYDKNTSFVLLPGDYGGSAPAKVKPGQKLVSAAAVPAGTKAVKADTGDCVTIQVKDGHLKISPCTAQGETPTTSPSSPAGVTSPPSTSPAPTTPGSSASPSTSPSAPGSSASPSTSPSTSPGPSQSASTPPIGITPSPSPTSTTSPPPGSPVTIEVCLQAPQLGSNVADQVAYSAASAGVLVVPCNPTNQTTIAQILFRWVRSNAVEPPLPTPTTSPTSVTPSLPGPVPSTTSATPSASPSKSPSTSPSVSPSTSPSVSPPVSTPVAP